MVVNFSKVASSTKLVNQPYHVCSFLKNTSQNEEVILGSVFNFPDVYSILGNVFNSGKSL